MNISHRYTSDGYGTLTAVTIFTMAKAEEVDGSMLETGSARFKTKLSRLRTGPTMLTPFWNSDVSSCFVSSFCKLSKRSRISVVRASFSRSSIDRHSQARRKASFHMSLPTTKSSTPLLHGTARFGFWDKTGVLATGGSIAVASWVVIRGNTADASDAIFGAEAEGGAGAAVGTATAFLELSES